MGLRKSLNGSSSGMLKARVLTAGLMALTFGLRIPFWPRPLDMDEGLYAYGGWQLLQGSVLYRDLWDFKPPGIYFLNALVFRLSSPDALNIYLCAAIFSSLTCFAVYRVADLLWGRSTACYSSLLFALFAVSPYWQGCGLNTEVFMIAPMVWSLYFVLRHAENGDIRAFFIAGLLLGIATLFKQVAGLGIVVAATAGFYTVKSHENGLRKALAFLLSFFAGVLLPWIVFALYFLYLGALKDFLFWQFVYPAHYMSFTFGTRNWERSYHRSLWVMYGTLTVWAFSIVGLVSVLKKSSTVKEKLACLFYPLSAIGVCAGWNFFPHYFIQMAPILAIFSGKGVAALFERVRTHGLRLLSALGLTVLMLSGAFFVQAHYKFWTAHSGGEMSLQEYLWAFPPTPMFGIARQLGFELGQITRETETIFVWKHHPEINFYALRKTPARSPIASLPELPCLEDETVQNVQEKRPDYVVVFDSLFLYNFPRMRELIFKDYTKTFGIEGLAYPEQGIYKRRVHEGR
jgi:4-amino-4-deoxy-L-arabinose transferase-like glycosyltransferase